MDSNANLTINKNIITGLKASGTITLMLVIVLMTVGTLKHVISNVGKLYCLMIDYFFNV